MIEDAIERITSHADRPIDTKLLSVHEDLADYFASRAHTLARDVLLEQLTHHADILLGLFDRPMTDTHRQQTP